MTCAKALAETLALVICQLVGREGVAFVLNWADIEVEFTSSVSVEVGDGEYASLVLRITIWGVSDASHMMLICGTAVGVIGSWIEEGVGVSLSTRGESSMQTYLPNFVVQ